MDDVSVNILYDLP